MIQKKVRNLEKLGAAGIFIFAKFSMHNFRKYFDQGSQTRCFFRPRFLKIICKNNSNYSKKIYQKSAKTATTLQFQSEAIIKIHFLRIKIFNKKSIFRPIVKFSN